MEYETNEAERAAKLRAAERAAAEERAQIKAEKKALRKKKAKRRRGAFSDAMGDVLDFLDDYKFTVINVLFILINITLCVLMCMGLAEVSDLYKHVAKICFYVGIGTCIVSVILGIVALSSDEDGGFVVFLNFSVFVVDFALFVIGAIALFVIVL